MPPKRKTSDKLAKPNKEAKLDSAGEESQSSTGSESDSTEHSQKRFRSATRPPRSKASKSAQDKDHEWEILGDDSREPLQVGVVAPARLILRFRHRQSRKEDKYEHAWAKGTVDWNDKDQIKKINAWRRQQFNRKNFPNKIDKSSWSAYELAYLELMLERVKLVAAADKDKRLPAQRKVFDAFNGFFEGRTDIPDPAGGDLPARPYRDEQALATFIRRKGTNIAILRDAIKGRMKDKSSNAQVPTITDAEIQAYQKDKTVISGAAIPAVSEDDNRNKVKPKATASPVHKKLAAQATGSQSVAEENKLTEELDASLSEDEEALPNAATTSKQVRPPANLIETPEDSDPLPDMVNESPRMAPESPIKSFSLAPSLPETTEDIKWTHHREAPVQPTPPEVVAQLVKTGYKFNDIPETNEEALARDYEEHERKKKEKKLDMSYLMKASADLQDRLKRHPVVPKAGSGRTKMTRDFRPEFHNEEGVRFKENWHEDSARREGAAAVDGVMNHATIPPVGYSGPINHLHSKSLLHPDQLLKEDASRAAIAKKYEWHDKSYKLPPGSEKKKQRNLYDSDSSETGDESEEEE